MPAQQLVDAGLDAAEHRPTNRVVLEFDPGRDGFGFINTFTWTDEDLGVLTSEVGPLVRGIGLGLPVLFGQRIGGWRGLFVGLAAGTFLSLSTAADRVIGRAAHRWRTFGLCGGMALLTKERWENVSDGPTIELSRELIRPILRIRQAQTVRAAWPRFLTYWLKSISGVGVFAPRALQAEFGKTMAQIDDGHLAILGLVGDTPDPFAMHQVVAFGYEMGLNQTKLMVYDPNAPGQTRHLLLHTEEGRLLLTTDLPTGPKNGGGYHISKRTGRLSMVFVLDI